MVNWMSIVKIVHFYESRKMKVSPAAVIYPKLISTNELSRDVYGLLGMPVDALDRHAVLDRVLRAVEEGQPFLLSTPNVNFLAESGRDASFRDSLSFSNLCCVDGMPIVWLARIFGITIRQRVSGSDLFDTVRSNCSPSKPIRVFLFGGGENVAKTVSGIINGGPGGMRCVGWLNPGFGTVGEMSTPSIIQTINRSNADLLAVFLSAKKAQSWLVLNHESIRVPVRGQFGATINYQAGIVRRAPVILQRLGFEWLWRIKEEPYLWRRYWSDGMSLARLVVTRALPIAVKLKWRRVLGLRDELSLEKQDRQDCSNVNLVGFATKTHVVKAIAFFGDVLAEHRDVKIDISQTRAIDPRFFGLLLMLKKQLAEGGKALKFTSISKRARRIFKRNGFEFLLD
jgi:N-acetylglucosaminyldiphosphoundecaprenol N-acetyl-beta-D-mannosaminyltransferase